MGDRVFCMHKCTDVIWRATQRGAQMGKTGTHGVCACEKHNNASMHDYVPDSCACVRNCGVDGRARVHIY
jgi:hypothetical protein